MKRSWANFCSKHNVSPRQREFGTLLFGLLGNPVFNLVDRRFPLGFQSKSLSIVLPHRVDPSMTIFAEIGPAQLISLRVWDVQLVELFQVFDRNAGLPGNWMLIFIDLLTGRFCIEKWTKGDAVVQTRINHFSKVQEKWIVGTALQTRTNFLGNMTIRGAKTLPLPPDCGRVEKHISFSSHHGVPPFEEDNALADDKKQMRLFPFPA